MRNEGNPSSRLKRPRREVGVLGLTALQALCLHQRLRVYWHYFDLGTHNWPGLLQEAFGPVGLGGFQSQLGGTELGVTTKEIERRRSWTWAPTKVLMPRNILIIHARRPHTLERTRAGTVQQVKLGRII